MSELAWGVKWTSMAWHIFEIQVKKKLTMNIFSDSLRNEKFKMWLLMKRNNGNISSLFLWIFSSFCFRFYFKIAFSCSFCSKLTFAVNFNFCGLFWNQLMRLINNVANLIELFLSQTISYKNKFSQRIRKLIYLSKSREIQCFRT